MSEREWDQFFVLFDKIVNRLPGTWREKAAEVCRRAQESGAEFDEFLSWFETSEHDT